MAAFRSAHAAHDDWREATEACLATLGAGTAGGSLGFLYVTDRLTPHLEAILDLLRGRTGVQNWVGTTGIGVAAIGGAGCVEYWDQPAMAVMLAEMPADSFRVFEPVHGGLAPFRTQYGGWLAKASPLFGLVHGDPRNRSEERRVGNEG